MVSFIDACEMQISPTPKLVQLKNHVMEHNAENRLSEETTPHKTSDWFHALQKFREETDRLSISMRWTAWIPVRHPGLSLTLLSPCRYHG